MDGRPREVCFVHRLFLWLICVHYPVLFVDRVQFERITALSRCLFCSIPISNGIIANKGGYVNIYHIFLVYSGRRLSKFCRYNRSEIKDEFDTGPGFSWITKGREIENYMSPTILENAVKKVHPKATGLSSKGPFDNCLSKYKTVNGKSKDSADKVKVAQEVTKIPANLDILDLKQQIKKLVDFIHEANDHNNA